MKKIVYGITTIMVLSTLLSGCKSNTAATQAAQGTQRRSSAKSTDTTSKTRQMGKADLYGEVTFIAGNEVTLKLIKIPEISTTQNAAQDKGTTSGDSSQSSAQSQGGDPSRGGGGSMGGGAPMDGGGGFPGGTSGTTQKKTTNYEYTGESKTILIPVGLSLASMGRSQAGTETSAKDFTDINKGDVLQVWYSDDDDTVITRVSISS
jgi:uncharacterized protein YceK